MYHSKLTTPFALVALLLTGCNSTSNTQSVADKQQPMAHININELHWDSSKSTALNIAKFGYSDDLCNGNGKRTLPVGRQKPFHNNGRIVATSQLRNRVFPQKWQYCGNISAMKSHLSAKMAILRQHLSYEIASFRKNGNIAATPRCTIVFFHVIFSRANKYCLGVP